MAQRLSGKQRASRIPLDYYKSRDRLSRWKLALSALALVGALGWLATGFSFGGPGLVGESALGRMRYSHGPVARVHATWDAKCDACHAPFRPIGQDAWVERLGLTTAEADGKCQGCHKVEDHHASMKPEGGSCASCHRDHRGRDASLVRLADADCLSCHADLTSHIKPSAEVAGYEDIASFPARHPEFRLMRKGAEAATDPGTLKFNHSLHMAPGLNDAKGGKPLFTLAQLSAEDQARYRRKGQQPGDGVRLDCASCHRPGDGDRPPGSSRSGAESAASLPDGGTGAYMRPIAYKTDCAACHKLDVPVSLGEKTATIPVPHRLQPAELHAMLTNASIGQSLGQDSQATEKAQFPGRALPGRPAVADGSARAEVESRVARAERILFGRGKGTCTECHRYKTPDGVREELDPSATLAAVQVEPTHVPTAWYEHARFDHSAHRSVSCKSCHEGAYPGESASRTSASVLIPGKALCASCHAPEVRSPEGLALGGAGYSCTECHRYHGGDHNPGRNLAGGSDGMDIRQFLLGTAGAKGEVLKSPSASRPANP